MPDQVIHPTPGASGKASPGSCSACRFWDTNRGRDDYCKRSAPMPGLQENDIARWRLTYASDWCGDGEAPNGATARTSCGNCRFWFRPENGIVPLQFGDRYKDWWQLAGHCRRYAPQASAELGGRSFWPVTHNDDTCGDGRPKA